MSMVRFATLCDKCQKRSREYECWPTCSECGDHVCTTCQRPGSATEDVRNEALCLKCYPKGVFVFDIEQPGEPAAGIMPFSDIVTVIVDSGDPGGDSPAEFEEALVKFLREWFDAKVNVRVRP